MSGPAGPGPAADRAAAPPQGPPHAGPPAASRWGRTAALTYLGIAAVAFAGVLVELARGRPGPATLLASVLTAPWSVLAAPLAPVLAARLPPAALRAGGLALLVVMTLLNAAIVHSIASRWEREARGS